MLVHGHIIGANNSPVLGALVIATVNGRTSSDSAQTDSAGNYALRLAYAFADTGFSVAVRALGYYAQSHQFSRLDAATHNVEADFRLTSSVQQLAGVQVKARRPILPHPEAAFTVQPGARGAILDASTGVSGDVTGDINAALAMVDGVLPTWGGGGLGLSAFGQGSDQNGATLNGADAAGTTIPRDGPRRGVRLSTYDPKLGRFSGIQTTSGL